MAEATRTGSIHRSKKIINISKQLLQLNTLRVFPVDPTTIQGNIVWEVIDVATKGIAYYHFLGREEKISEFQLTSADDCKMIKEFRSSNGIIKLNDLDLEIMLFKEDRCALTLRYVPAWYTEEDLHQELKLVFYQHARVYNIYCQTKKLTKMTELSTSQSHISSSQ